MLPAIAFRAVGNAPLGESLLKARGQAIHAVGRLKRDEWNGQVRIQLEIEDAASAGGVKRLAKSLISEVALIG